MINLDRSRRGVGVNVISFEGYFGFKTLAYLIYSVRHRVGCVVVAVGIPMSSSHLTSEERCSSVESGSKNASNVPRLLTVGTYSVFMNSSVVDVTVGLDASPK